MMQRNALWLAVLATAALTACGEKPQNLVVGTNDAPAYQGTQNGFAETGWKAGDKTSWEQGLKARGQNSQNEYNRSK